MATALAVVETIAGGVGSTITGGSGAVANKDTAIEQSQFDMLSILRDLSLKSLRSLGEIRDKIHDMLSFDKKKARDERQRLSELAAKTGAVKGATGPGGKGGIGGEEVDLDENKLFGAGGILGFLGLTKVAQMMKGLFAPLIKMFGKGGRFAKLLAPITRLLPFLGRFGPIGLVITAIMLVVKYSQELADALAPAIDGIKRGLVKLKPVFDVLTKVFDVIIKSSLATIGAGLEIAVAGIEASLSMLWSSIVLVKEIVMGIVTLDMERIKTAFQNWGKEWRETFDKLIATIKNAFIGLVNKVGEIFGVENAWDFVKDKWNEIKAAITAGFDTAIKWITDKWEDFAVEPFNNLKEKLDEWKKKIWDGEEGKLFGLKLPEFNLDGLFEKIEGWRNGIWNSEEGKLFGIELPEFSLDGLKETLTGWGKKIYDHKEKKLFTMQLPTFSLSGITDTLTSFRNMIYNPDTGAVFGINFTRMFSEIKMPNFGEIFNSMVGAILPEPGSGWFAKQLYRLFPDLKVLASKASIGSENVAAANTAIDVPDAETVGKKFEKEKVDTKGKTEKLKPDSSMASGSYYSYYNSTGGVVNQSSTSTHVGPLTTDIDPYLAEKNGVKYILWG